MVGVFLSLLDIIGHHVFSWYKQQTGVTAVSLAVCFYKHTSRHYKYLGSINVDSLLLLRRKGSAASPSTMLYPRRGNAGETGSSSLLLSMSFFICFKPPFLFLEVNLHTITSTTVNVRKSTSADRCTSKWPAAKPLPAAKNPKARFSNLLYPDIKKGKGICLQTSWQLESCTSKSPIYLYIFIADIS